MMLVVVKSVLAMMDSFSGMATTGTGTGTGAAVPAAADTVATGCHRLHLLPGYSIAPETRGCRREIGKSNR